MGMMRAKGDFGPSPVLSWVRNDVSRRECNRVIGVASVLQAEVSIVM